MAGSHTGKNMKRDLTTGNITGNLLLFALPLMAGNVLQQFYNIVDTLIVGRALGSGALAAVGSAYTLMTFLTSILIGLCMGSSAYISILYGERKESSIRKSVFLSFLMIGAIAVLLNILVFAGLDLIIGLLRVPTEIYGQIREYLFYIFMGIPAAFLYNYFGNFMRAVGNSLAPLLFLGASVILNVILDILLVLVFPMGIRGAAVATVISQYVAGVGIWIYCRSSLPELLPGRQDMLWDRRVLKKIFHLSFLTCLQQSVMNFGILMVQGLVNSFGTVVMAGFAAAVKIDTVAYMPVQDFGNAFSVFTAQNYGGKQEERIRKAIKSAVFCVFLFCGAVSALICIFAGPMMGIFVKAQDTAVIAVGIQYLRIEGAFYLGIGLLFLLYGYYRAIEKPGMSLILTICSLGIRVMLAYALAPVPGIGVTGIWAAIPIGWFLADAVGIGYYFYMERKGCK